MQGIFRKENTDKALKYGIYRHLPTYEKIIRNLVSFLAKNTDKVLTHNYIMQEVWGSVQGTETPSLRVFMATLRKKIEPDTSNPKYIQTHVGVGYRMLRQTEKADQTSESLS